MKLYAGLSIGYKQAQNGGIIWQLLGHFNNKNHQELPHVLGVGGRYDYMLSEYQQVYLISRNIDSKAKVLNQLKMVFLFLQKTGSKSWCNDPITKYKRSRLIICIG